jgi:DNA uptake protein ComE-like DNA-binding protein
MATPPQLDPAQRAAALAKAAEVRQARSEFRNRLKLGAVSLGEALEAGETDDVVGKLKVVALLESLPGVGKVKARRIMEEVGIADTRRVRGLGAQQKAALLERLG